MGLDKNSAVSELLLPTDTPPKQRAVSVSSTLQLLPEQQSIAQNASVSSSGKSVTEQRDATRRISTGGSKIAVKSSGSLPNSSPYASATSSPLSQPTSTSSTFSTKRNNIVIHAAIASDHSLPNESAHSSGGSSSRPRSHTVTSQSNSKKVALSYSSSKFIETRPRSVSDAAQQSSVATSGSLSVSITSSGGRLEHGSSQSTDQYAYSNSSMDSYKTSLSSVNEKSSSHAGSLNFKRSSQNKLASMFRRKSNTKAPTIGNAASTRSLVDRLTGGLLAPFGSMTVVSSVIEAPVNRADLLVLLEILTRPRKYQWNSPVIRDEMYIIEILAHGDAHSFDILKKRSIANEINRASSSSDGMSSTLSISDSSATTSHRSTESSLMSVHGSSNQTLNTSRSMLHLKDQNGSSTSVSNHLSAGLSASRNFNGSICKSIYLLFNIIAGTLFPALHPPHDDHLNIMINVVGASPLIGAAMDIDRPRRISITQADTTILAPKLPKRQMPTQIVDVRSLSKPQLVKFNSCSTLFTVDNTVFKPTASPQQMDITLKAVAHAIMSHLDRSHTYFDDLASYEASKNLRASECFSKRVINSSDVLSEKLHPIWKARYIPDDIIDRPQLMHPPTFEEIHTFLKQVFGAANLSAEVGIITLIYLERFLQKTKIALHGVNVFRSILGSLMLAFKVWDDEAVWNQDFIAIMSDLDKEDLNYLERWWLGKVGFDVSVKRAVFARYWFELRELSEKIWGVGLEKHRKHSTGSWTNVKANRPSATGKHKSSHLKNVSEAKKVSGSHQELSVNTSGVKKPLTEYDLHRLSASTTYSQSKIRQNFSQALSAPATDEGTTIFTWDHQKVPTTRSCTSDNLQKQFKDVQKSAVITKGTSVSSVAGSQISERVNHKDLKDFGWGGSNLRRSKSDHQFMPAVPAASVL